MQKYYANANMLLRKFSYCSPDVKCCMFKSYCSTKYCSSMWFDIVLLHQRRKKENCLQQRPLRVTKLAKNVTLPLKCLSCLSPVFSFWENNY